MRRRPPSTSYPPNPTSQVPISVFIRLSVKLVRYQTLDQLVSFCAGNYNPAKLCPVKEILLFYFETEKILKDTKLNVAP